MHPVFFFFMRVKPYEDAIPVSILLLLFHGFLKSALKEHAASDSINSAANTKSTHLKKFIFLSSIFRLLRLFSLSVQFRDLENNLVSLGYKNLLACLGISPLLPFYLLYVKNTESAKFNPFALRQRLRKDNKKFIRYLFYERSVQPCLSRNL